MADGIEFKLEGMDEVRRQLRALPQNLRRKVLMKGLRKAAAVVLKEARARVPVLSPENAISMPYRKPGTVKKALTVRVSKAARQEGNVGVFIGVKPAKGAQYETTRHQVLGQKYTTKKLKAASKRGTKSRDDPYYWQWLEFGHRIVRRGRRTGVFTSTTVSVRNPDGSYRRQTYKRDLGSLRSRRINSTGFVPAIPFIRPAAEKLTEALSIFQAEIKIAVEAMNRSRK